MKISLLLAHPRRDSFNHALAESVRDALLELEHDVRFHDLYVEGFDPLLTAEECYTSGESAIDSIERCADPILSLHRAEIQDADGLVVVHPNWWGKPPAILAGWLDRVLVPGVAYRLTTASGEPEPLLALRTALVVNTTDTPAEREASVFGDPLAAIWERCVLPYCGANSVSRTVVGPVTDADARQRKAWLREVTGAARRLFPSGQ